MDEGLPSRIPVSIVYIFIAKTGLEVINSTLHNWMEYLRNEAYRLRFRHVVSVDVYMGFLSWDELRYATTEEHMTMNSLIWTGRNAVIDIQDAITDALRVFSTSAGDIVVLFCIAPEIGSVLITALFVVAIGAVRSTRSARADFSTITKATQYTCSHNVWFSQNISSILFNGTRNMHKTVHTAAVLNNEESERHQAPISVQSYYLSIVDVIHICITQGLIALLFATHWSSTQIISVIPLVEAIRALSDRVYWVIYTFVTILRAISEWEPAQRLLEQTYHPSHTSAQKHPGDCCEGVVNHIIRCELARKFPSMHVSVNAGEMIQICGPSGSGKTVLLKQLLISLTNNINTDIHCPWIYLAQAAELARDDVRTARMCLVNDDSISDGDVRALATELGIGYLVQGDKLHRAFQSPSGGEVSRLTLLRAFLPIFASSAPVCSVMILDEICAHIDDTGTQLIITWIQGIARRLKIMVIFVEHGYSSPGVQRLHMSPAG